MSTKSVQTTMQPHFEDELDQMIRVFCVNRGISTSHTVAMLMSLVDTFMEEERFDDDEFQFHMAVLDARRKKAQRAKARRIARTQVAK
jgi:hypothetical protein